MGTIQGQRKCKTCGRKTLHAKPTPGFFGGLVLSVVTLGLYAPFWVLGSLLGSGPWRCQACGQKRWT
jgi:hypothetical protein